jgi:hypothetical protein
MERHAVPDVVLLCSEWPARALLNAQLVEEGYDVVTTDQWPIPREFLRAHQKPRALVIDLQGLPHPEAVLDEVRYLIPPHHVVVIAAIATMDTDKIRQMGFRALARPVAVGDVVAAVKDVLTNH